MADEFSKKLEAAQQGNGNAKCEIAIMYFAKKDEKSGAAWMRKWVENWNCDPSEDEVKNLSQMHGVNEAVTRVFK